MKLYEISFTMNGRRSVRYCHFTDAPTVDDACKALADRLPLVNTSSIFSYADLVRANGIEDVRWRLVESRSTFAATMPFLRRRLDRPQK